MGEIGEFEKRIMLMVGEGQYSKERIHYLGRVNDMLTEAKEEFLQILKNQQKLNVRDENERLKWFMKWFSPSELEVDEDGFVKWSGKK